jgi:hypothetical protein
MMGSKYTVQVWGQHFKDCGINEYSYTVAWAGQSLPRALWELVKAKRRGFGCTTLEWR